MLNISSANIGYDVNGMNQLINDVNTQCVVPACASLRREANNLRQTIDTVWVGKSAEAFKDKVTRDTETVCTTLEKVGEMIRNQMNNAGSNVEEYDQEIARTLFGASVGGGGPTIRRPEPSTPTPPAPSDNPNEPSQQNIPDESKDPTPTTPTPTPTPEPAPTPTPAPAPEPTPAPTPEPTPAPAPEPVPETPKPGGDDTPPQITPETPKPSEDTPSGEKPSEPKPEEPKQEEPKQEEPKSEDPKEEEPKQEEPKQEEPTPTPEEPKPEEPTPTPEEPTPSEPTPSEPKPEEPTPETPTPTPGDPSNPTPATGDKSIDQLRDELGLRGSNTIDNKFGYYDEGLTSTQTQVLNTFDQYTSSIGMSQQDRQDWAWIMCRESGLKPSANHADTHFGLGQLTQGNINTYSPNPTAYMNGDPQVQLETTYNYIIATYGSISAAKAHWEEHNWY